MTGGEFVYLLTAFLAGIFLGATVYERVRNDAARLTHRKHFQHSLIVVLIAFGLGGLGALAARVDSLLLQWVASVALLGAITYGALHQHAALRGKSR